MGIFDMIGDLNPFKKKEEFSFGQQDDFSAMPGQQAPMGNPSGYGQPGNPMNPLGDSQYAPPQMGMDNPNPMSMDSAPTTPSFASSPEQPMNDHRMRMPLGENVRAARMEAMHSDNDNFGSQHHNPLQKDLEIISSKLDYLKASLEAINQRLSNLEHMARQESEKRW